jgi:Ca2+/Na+ antiporter
MKNLYILLSVLIGFIVPMVFFNIWKIKEVIIFIVFFLPLYYLFSMVNKNKEKKNDTGDKE